MKKILLATAVVLSAGSAFAQENNVVLSFDTFEKNDVTTEGLKYDFEGSMGDFAYEGFAFDGDVEGIDAKAAGVKANWTGVNLGNFAFGPAASYGYASLDGASSDPVVVAASGFDRPSISGVDGSDFALGAAMKTSFGSVDIKGDALFSLDTSEAWVGTLNGSMPIGDRMSVMGGYSYVDVGDKFESHQFELGARYDVTPNAFVQGTVDAERSAGETGAGASIGLGLRF